MGKIQEGMLKALKKMSKNMLILLVMSKKCQLNLATCNVKNKEGDTWLSDLVGDGKNSRIQVKQ